MRMTSNTLSSLAVAAGLLAATAAQAVSLVPPVSPAPFADTVLSGTTAAARPELNGVVLVDDLTPFSFNGISGTVQNRVVRENVAGTLDFYWKVNVAAGSTGGGISAFRLIDFGYGNLTDADWSIDGLGTFPATTGRLFNPASYPTGAINFLFSEPVSADSSSRFFFLHTAATSYTKTASFDMLGGPSQALSGVTATYAPTAVPEPESLAMAAFGLAVAGVMLRRKRVN